MDARVKPRMTSVLRLLIVLQGSRELVVIFGDKVDIASFSISGAGDFSALFISASAAAELLLTTLRRAGRSPAATTFGLQPRGGCNVVEIASAQIWFREVNAPRPIFSTGVPGVCRQKPHTKNHSE
jgi:hypothetical protein